MPYFQGFPAGDLNFFNVLGFRSPITLLNFKLDVIAFCESFVSGRFYGRKVNKYIVAVFLTDEAIPLSVIEPFHNSCSQIANLLLNVLTLSRNPDRHSGKGDTHQSEIDLGTSRGPFG